MAANIITNLAENITVFLNNYKAKECSNIANINRQTVKPVKNCGANI